MKAIIIKGIEMPEKEGFLDARIYGDGTVLLPTHMGECDTVKAKEVEIPSEYKYGMRLKGGNQMKDITIKNENGVEINAKIMTIDELMHEWKKILPGLPFYTWLDMLKECGIVTMREFYGMQPEDFIVKGLW